MITHVSDFPDVNPDVSGLLRPLIEAASDELNPYLSVFNSLPTPGPLLFGADFETRRYLVQTYAWAIPDPVSLELVRTYSPIIEIGAGTGYWAALLQAMGADVIPIEKYKRNNPYGHRFYYTDVKCGPCTAARDYPDRTLFLCWPPYKRPMALRALRAYRGEHVIYIGESCGCTASPGFHNELACFWDRVEFCPLHRWPNTNDGLYVYRRKPKRARSSSRAGSKHGT